MRPEPITLTLGDRTAVVRPLTLAQIRRIEETLRNMLLSELEKSIGVLSIALSRNNPDIVVEDLEVGLTDLSSIVQQILRIGGMVAVEDDSGNSAAAPTSGT